MRSDMKQNMVIVYFKMNIENIQQNIEFSTIIGSSLDSEKEFLNRISNFKRELEENGGEFLKLRNEIFDSTLTPLIQTDIYSLTKRKEIKKYTRYNYYSPYFYGCSSFLDLIKYINEEVSLENDLYIGSCHNFVYNNDNGLYLRNWDEYKKLTTDELLLIEKGLRK